MQLDTQHLDRSYAIVQRRARADYESPIVERKWWCFNRLQTRPISSTVRTWANAWCRIAKIGSRLFSLASENGFIDDQQGDFVGINCIIALNKLDA